MPHYKSLGQIPPKRHTQFRRPDGELSDMVIGLERDQQNADNPDLTCVRVLKNRFSGETGIATRLHYDKITGMLTESTLNVETPF